MWLANPKCDHVIRRAAMFERSSSEKASCHLCSTTRIRHHLRFFGPLHCCAKRGGRKACQPSTCRQFVFSTQMATSCVTCGTQVARESLRHGPAITRAADYPNVLPGKHECIEARVIAGPCRKLSRATCVPQVTHDVAIWVENTNCRHVDG